MKLRSGTRREREGRPHFGVKQCKSDILPTHTCTTLGSCRAPRLLRNHTLITGMCFAGVLLNLWCQPCVRHTRQVSYTPLFLQAFLCCPPLLFSLLCSLCSPALASSVVTAASSWCAATHGKCVLWAGYVV